jgi:hypothetical protein
VLKILIDSNEDRIFVVYNNGFAVIFDAFSMLHMMFHEATACHVTGEIVDLISIFADLVTISQISVSAEQIFIPEFRKNYNLNTTGKNTYKELWTELYITFDIPA